jgi:hypothetical protein
MEEGEGKCFLHDGSTFTGKWTRGRKKSGIKTEINKQNKKRKKYKVEFDICGDI